MPIFFIPQRHFDIMQYKILTVILILGIIAGFFVNTYLIINKSEEFVVEKYEYETVKIDLLAVTGAENGGILLPMFISAQEGHGKLYVNIDDPTFIGDTQQSARVAVDEAARFTNVDFSKIDILLSIETVPTLVSGPSAGAAMTVAMAAAVLNKRINQEVAMTGTITKGGEVGPVASILEKAAAAKAAGKRLFLVPEGTSVVRTPVQVCQETVQGGLTTKKCTVNYENTNVASAVGIEVQEIKTIEEAFKKMVI